MGLWMRRQLECEGRKNAEKMIIPGEREAFTLKKCEVVKIYL